MCVLCEIVLCEIKKLKKSAKKFPFVVTFFEILNDILLYYIFKTINYKKQKIPQDSINYKLEYLFKIFPGKNIF